MSDDEMDLDDEMQLGGEDSNIVIEKYKAAAEVANRALVFAIQQVTPGKKVVDICTTTDEFIENELNKVYNKAKVVRGLGFPTSVSPNQLAGYVSPLKADGSIVLQEGDVVKITLGAHIDGFVADAGHTLICQADSTSKTTGRKADVICAAHFAAECALRLLRPGNTNKMVTKAIADVAEAFKVHPCETVESRQLKRFTQHPDKVILNVEAVEGNPEEFKFEENEAYSIDIVMSTGEGHLRPSELKTTVFQRNVGHQYKLRMKASRYAVSEIDAKFKGLPFGVRSLDEKKARLGITELVSHEVVMPFPVMTESEGEFIAQFKFTAMILPGSIQRLTAAPLPFVQSDYEIADPKLKAILQMGLKRKPAGKKKKKKKGGASAAAPMEQ